MDLLKRNIKRVLTDAAGYLLVLAAIATGWLPGPGGIPLAIAGLGLLSIHNKWAHNLREYLLKNGGKLVDALFPRNMWVEWAYDIIAALMFALCIVLEIRHAALWEISLGIIGLCLAIAMALLNRDRLNRWRR